jgi:hypothetical protein
MLDGNLNAGAVWTLRLALAAAMLAVDNPFRLAAAGLILSLQVPVQSGIAAWAGRRRAAPQRR